MGLAVRWMCVKIHMCNLGGRLRSSPTPCSLFIYLFWPRHRTCEILVLQPGTEPRPMAVRAPSPYYWTAREFPLPFFLKQNISVWLGWVSVASCKISFGT